MSTGKYCPRCQHVLPLTEFSRCSSKRDGRQRYCKGCTRSYYSAYSSERREQLAARERERYAARHDEQRQKRRQWKRSNRYKANAHLAVSAAIKRGELPHPLSLPCTHCGGLTAEYHHEDYSQPLLVIALCRQCHALLHAQAARAAV